MVKLKIDFKKNKLLALGSVSTLTSEDRLRSGTLFGLSVATQAKVVSRAFSALCVLEVLASWAFWKNFAAWGAAVEEETGNNSDYRFH